MTEFLQTALSMPTLAFTAMLGLVLLYWVSVMLGALDLHLLDPGGALDGVEGISGIDGAVDGAAEGLDGAAEAADLDADGVGGGGLAAVLHALRLRYAPLTVIVSFVVLFGWVGSFFGSRYVAPVVPLGGLLTGALILLAALLIAIPLTSLATRPLAKLFKTEPARSNRDLIGHVVTIKTGTVDAELGQATLKDGQAGFLLKVRCSTPNSLGRGDRALIVDWDEETNVFEIEPMSEIDGRSRDPGEQGTA